MQNNPRCVPFDLKTLFAECEEIIHIVLDYRGIKLVPLHCIIKDPQCIATRIISRETSTPFKGRV